MKQPNLILVAFISAIAGAAMALIPVYISKHKQPLFPRARVNTMMERTFAIIKPDAVSAKNSGKIIDRIEQEGFNIIGLNKINMTREQANLFYDVHRERPFFGELVEFMTSGPVVVMTLEKEDAIRAWRELMGATNPAEAEDGTIRSMYGSNIGENATHGSDSPETAIREISLFFPNLS